MESEEFNPKDTIDEEKLMALANWKMRYIEGNRNFAFNSNDKLTIET